jgi:glutamate--cysteine ligase
LIAVEKRLAVLSKPQLASLARGVEKESLRTQPDGRLAETPHPIALGSALTHPHITTDFSEAQLELITGVHPSPESCAAELTEIHQAVMHDIGTELLWASSMPCGLPEESRIPLARYGSSNVARAKTVYRQGLSHRYGRKMQTISGVHYNFSLPAESWESLARLDGEAANLRAFRDAAYFGLIRNFRRHSWLLLYLFGASPAVCSSFVEGRDHPLQKLSDGSYYLPWATSLRMGPLGYQSDAQASLAVSFNSIDSYARSLNQALHEPYPAYEALGIIDPADGLYRQLNTTLLQIENEFYSTIRPKRTIRSGERPLRALAERGVEYVEVRCLDLDPFEPIGVRVETMRFLDVFLLHCLLADSPADTPAEIAAISANQHRVAQRGREPGLTLQRQGESVSLDDWAEDLLAAMAPIADALDQHCQGTPHHRAVVEARQLVAQPQQTPSARVLDEMARHHGNSFSAFSLARSVEHRRVLREKPFTVAQRQRFADMATASLAEQSRIEASETLSFEAFRQRYISGASPVDPG